MLENESSTVTFLKNWDGSDMIRTFDFVFTICRFGNIAILDIQTELLPMHGDFYIDSPRSIPFFSILYPFKFKPLKD